MSDVAPARAYFALGALTVINFVNYADRYILAGVLDDVQKRFQLDDTVGGFLSTFFIVVYMCASPLGGYLGDRIPRRLLIAAAVLIWSLATVGTALAVGFFSLLVARAFTGIGEAGYGTVAPTVISDLFERQRRTRMLSIFYLAMPLGAAAGFTVGGTMAERGSWQHAFFIGGIPGLFLAAFALFMPEPKRGAMDGGTRGASVGLAEGFAALKANTRYWYVVAALTLMTFSIGGLSFWMPKYLSAERAFSKGEAGLALGATTVLGGIVGTLVGGYLGDRFDRRRPGAGVLISGIGLLAAAPFMVGAVVIPHKAGLLACLLAAQFFVFLNNGPLNAAIINVVAPELRAFAFGTSLLVMHALGDAASPTLIGAISDRSSLGTAVLLNAIPVAVGGLLLFPAVKLFRHERPSPSSSAP